MRASNVAFSIICGPVICCYVVFAACFCPARLRRHVDSDEKRRFERRQKMAPRPLPHRPLERSLTIPVQRGEKPLLSLTNRGKTFAQPQSRLMQLPLELRRMIYKAVVGDTTIHMILKEQRLGHLRCKADDALDCPLGYNGQSLSRACCWGTTDSANIWSPRHGVQEFTDGNIVPFLRSCRQIYSEAIDYLYATNTFSFSDLDCLRYFSCTILPSRFALVRSLDLEWFMAWPIYDPIAQNLLLSNPPLYPPHDEATWEGTWRIIADMPNLEFLRVSLLYFDGFRDRTCELKMLDPLRKVTRPKRFEVHVSWEGEDVQDVPFKLIRPISDEAQEDDL